MDQGSENLNAFLTGEIVINAPERVPGVSAYLSAFIKSMSIAVVTCAAINDEGMVPDDDDGCCSTCSKLLSDHSLTPMMTSHSLRGGPATELGRVPKLRTHWIAERGGWDINGQAGLGRMGLYICHSHEEDLNVAGVLSGFDVDHDYKPPPMVACTESSLANLLIDNNVMKNSVIKHLFPADTIPSPIMSTLDNNGWTSFSPPPPRNGCH